MIKQIIDFPKLNFSLRKSRRFLTLLLTLLWLPCVPSLHGQASPHQSIEAQNTHEEEEEEEEQGATALEPGNPIEREISDGHTQRYLIKASAGQFIGVTIQQLGIDVAAELLGTDNTLIADYDGEIRNQGTEDIAFVAETTNMYTLAIKAKLKNAPTGRYQIRVMEMRAATNNDRSLQEARKLETRFVRLHNAGKYDEARPLIERALATAEKVLGADDVYVARLTARLADSYHAKIDYAKAKLLYERALAILEKELGPEHPQTALVTNRLGNVCHGTNEVAKADKLLNRALEMSEKTLGPEHPQVALCLTNLGQLHDNRGDAAMAEQLYQRALTITEKLLEQTGCCSL
ncbi:MAG: tetratricopeptide repeat-containing protein [Pyrinomonadaceae bacterium]